VSVARDSVVPLYAQVKAELEHEIRTSMKPGDPLPPEPELERRFSVSRITIRRALDDLAGAGLIVRKQGRGTFVREHRITQELTRLMSWTVAMREMGLEPRTLSSSLTVVEPPAEVAEHLRTGTAKVIRLERLRAAGDGPVALMTNYVPTGLVPGLETQGLVDDSLYATLAAHRIVPSSAVDRVEARRAIEDEARMLGLEEDGVVLAVMRATYDASGRPLYVAVVVNRADIYSYTVRVDGRGRGTPQL
jgi:GntR family transcriptional regulator